MIKKTKVEHLEDLQINKLYFYDEVLFVSPYKGFTEIGTTIILEKDGDWLTVLDKNSKLDCLYWAFCRFYNV